MFCNKCGSQMSEGMNFCGVCGAPLATKCEAQINVAGTQETSQNTAESTVQLQTSTNQNTTEATRRKKKNTFLKTFLSILCVIMIFFFSFVALTVFTVRTTISKKNVERVMENVDAGDFIKDANLGKLDDSMTSREANKLFNRPYVKEYINDIVSEYTGYLLGGEAPRGIRGKDLVKLMEDNRDDIEEVLGKKLTQKDFDNAYEYGEAEKESEIGILSGNIRTNSTFELARIYVSVVALIILFILTALFVFLLFKSRKYHSSSLLWSGYTFVALAVMFGLVALLKNLIPAIIGAEEPLIAEVVSLVSGALTIPVLVSSAVTLIIGVLHIGIYMIVSKSKNSK